MAPFVYNQFFQGSSVGYFNFSKNTNGLIYYDEVRINRRGADRRD